MSSALSACPGRRPSSSGHGDRPARRSLRRASHWWTAAPGTLAAERITRRQRRAAASVCSTTSLSPCACFAERVFCGARSSSTWTCTRATARTRCWPPTRTRSPSPSTGWRTIRTAASRATSSSTSATAPPTSRISRASRECWRRRSDGFVPRSSSTSAGPTRTRATGSGGCPYRRPGLPHGTSSSRPLWPRPACPSASRWPAGTRRTFATPSTSTSGRSCSFAA